MGDKSFALFHLSSSFFLTTIPTTTAYGVLEFNTSIHPFIREPSSLIVFQLESKLSTSIDERTEKMHYAILTQRLAPSLSPSSSLEQEEEDDDDNKTSVIATHRLTFGTDEVPFKYYFYTNDNVSETEIIVSGEVLETLEPLAILRACFFL